MPVRIAYFGLPLGAVVLLHAGAELVSIALGHPKAIGARRVRRLARCPVLDKPSLDDDAVAEHLARTKPDAILSWFWPRRIPQRVLDLAPRGAFGVHPSLLPRHRGADPYFHAILVGDRETGVTLHRLDASYDTGRVIDHRALTIRDDENAWLLARRLDRPSLRLLLDCARRLNEGDAMLGEPQDDALSTPAEAPSEDDLVLDWNRDAAYLARLVRAAAPSPGAIAQLGDALVAVIEARAVSHAPAVLEPGEAYFVDGRVHVRTGDGGALRIDRARIEETEGEAGDLVTVGQELHGEAIARLVPRV
jgi:methionyl-tRNA formyltransferase